MPWWQVTADAIGAALLLLIAYGLALVARRRILSRNHGTFEVSYRVRPTGAGRGWLLGLGRYQGESLEWFRIFSLSPRPKQVWDRRRLSYVSRRSPTGEERMSLYPDHIVVTCEIGDRAVDLAMSPDSLMGLQSWLESMPPRSPEIV
ncbi:MAG: DUF2550 domain-containing protein [Nocardioides sp.]